MCVHHGDANERQGGELYIVQKEEGIEKRQPARPEPAIFRSIVDPLASCAMATASSHQSLRRERIDGC